LRTLDSEIARCNGNVFEFSTDGNLLLRSQVSGGLTIWDPITGDRLGRMTYANTATEKGDGGWAMFRPSGSETTAPQEVVIGRTESPITPLAIRSVPDLGALREIPLGVNANISRFAPDGTALIVGSHDGTIRRVSPADGAIQSTWS